MRLRTEIPRGTSRAPHFAPLFGALSMPAADLREVAVDPGAPAPITARPTSMVPEIFTGLAIAGGAGGLTGALAAGAWQGAAIGAGLNVAGWSLFTLLANWRHSDSRERTILGIAGALGGAMTLWFVLARRKKNKGVTS